MTHDDHDDLPVIPPRNRAWGTPRRTDGAIAKCGECGRIVYRIESYSCNNINCPIQSVAS